MKITAGVAWLALTGAAAAQPSPDVLLEAWRSYAMALEVTDEAEPRAALSDGHFAFLAALDACQPGMARPSCWDRAAATEIARLRAATNGTLADDVAIGPIVMECPGLPADTHLTMIWGEPNFAVVQWGEQSRVLQSIGGEAENYASDVGDGPSEMTWGGTEVALALDGAPAVTCNVVIGED